MPRWAAGGVGEGRRQGVSYYRTCGYSVAMLGIQQVRHAAAQRCGRRAMLREQLCTPQHLPQSSARLKFDPETRSARDSSILKS